MLDVRPTAYIIPVAEQEFASLTPTVHIENNGTVPALITGHVHIYRESTGLRLYTSELAITTIAAGAVADVAALTPWSPPTPADDDYFITCDITATATIPHTPPGAVTQLGPYTFDIKPVGMGPAPAAHAVTHEDGGSDEIDVTGLAGVLTEPQHAIIRPAVGEASNAAPTPNANTTDVYFLSALATDATFGKPTGSPVDGQKLLIRILDHATPRALTWTGGPGGYISRGATLPAITTSSKYMFIGLIYNTLAGTWDCVATTVEA